MKQLIPHFPLPDGFGSADEYLKELVNRGARQRYGQDKPNGCVQTEYSKAAERIGRELGVIAELGCADYFLVLWDALRHARQEGIAIGPGRGSAAGSIVNYCLGITQIDPLEYGLLFERFLNTNRSYYPCADIDIDGDERLREELLCYLPKCYGKNHVALIANHACGIVISPVDVTQRFHTTTYMNRDGETLPVIEAKISEIDDARFIVFHFLYLPELSVIRDTKTFVEQRKGITIKDIPLDDADTFRLFCEGQTVSTFQFDSEGISKWLRELQPTSICDLVALDALYRPGVMDWIPDFIARKHGEKPAACALPAMEECLKDTYGMVVYQEQIMQLVQTLADFTPNESDRLRRAFMKRKEEDVAHFKNLFIEKATTKGCEREQIEQMWEDWNRIGCYLFNKSHAVCYTLLGYQTAYLKTHYPVEYMAARLRYDLNNQEALSDCLFNNNYTEWLGNDLDKDLQECHRMNIRVTGLDRTRAANRVTIDADGAICCN